MRAARRHRWLCAVLLAPLAALAVSASSFSALRCTMSGLLVPETCCPIVADGAETPAAAVLQAPGCCERILLTNDKAPAVSGDRAGELPAGAVAISVARVPVTPIAAVPATRHHDVLRPPGRAAPVFLLTHAFLI
ncbi:MAG TPA: hypothetical protein VHO67_10380 [Polyangia bacterium]|nr:hypothetical protein [Polyangia bacterium]